jgi:heat shock protein HslJ
MNRLFLGALFAAATLGLSSCSSTQKTAQVNDLEGTWQIVKLNGKKLPSGMETKPYIIFNTKEGRIHGNAGCNIFNGKYQTRRGSSSNISFPNTITTMMSCPDLETEQQIMEAINSVASFEKSGKGYIFLNKNGEKVLRISK